MKKFTDESGWVRAAVCFAALLTHHGLRDALITALPTIAAPDTPTAPTLAPTTTKLPSNVTQTTAFPSPTPANTLPYDAQRHGSLERQYAIDNSGELTINRKGSTNATLWDAGQDERGFQGGRNVEVVHAAPPPPGFHSPGTKVEDSDDVEMPHPSFPSSVFKVTAPREPWEQTKPKRVDSVHSTSLYEDWGKLKIKNKETDKRKVSHGIWDELKLKGEESDGSPAPHEQHEAKREESHQFKLSNVPVAAPSLRQRTKTAENGEVEDGVAEDRQRGENVIPRPPLHMQKGGRGATLQRRAKTVKNVLPTTRRRERSIGGHLTEGNDRAAIGNTVRGGSGHAKNTKTEERPTASEDLDQQKVEVEEEEELNPVRTKVSSLAWYALKEDWSLMLEGAVLSSVFWGWLFTALLADSLMDKVGVVRILALSEGLAGLLGLLTHAVSLAGPWALLGLRVVQGAVQGVSYPAVVRVLEGVPSSGRAAMAVLVYMGPALGTGLGAGLGSLSKWYAAPYVMGSVAVALTPLCLLLPPPPEKTPHKDMPWKEVLGCRGVWACIGVHLANTWVLHTLLLGLPLCLTYTPLNQPSAGGWVVAASAVVVGGEVRFDLFLAAKLSMKRPMTVLTRRRVPVVAGTAMVTAALITMSTAGLDSAAVLVGVGVGLAGVGAGVARMGYRLNVDDMAPLGAWRVTRVLDVVAVVTAAACPLAVCALAEAGHSGWVAVWLVPLFALVPAAVVYLFLLTSNQQPWDQKAGEANGAVPNGVAGGAPVSPVNGLSPASFSVGRQSFKSARSNLTFKTARSRSRTRTVSCRTIDDDLEGDMHSAVGTNSVDCRSVVEEPDPECVSVASSSTFKSDGADMHSVVDEAGGTTAPPETQRPGQKFGSMLVNGGTTDRTTAWLSSHHDLVLEAEQTPTRAGTHAANAIHGLLW